MKCQHSTLIALSGLLWLAIGIFLLTLGINLVLQPLSNSTPHFSLITSLSKTFVKRENSVTVIITIALFIGYLKGKMMLAKSVERQVMRIERLPNPASLKYLYSKAYYFLIGAMMGLGILLRFLPITPDTRGAIDIAIGAGLINSSILYFRHIASKYFPRSKKNKT